METTNESDQARSEGRGDYECWARHTVMDGKVVVYATKFRVGAGMFGQTKDPLGPYDVSASRNCIMVHSATIRTQEDLTSFTDAIAAAWKMHKTLLRCDGRPEWDQPNTKAE